jgi:hypothetical protein
MSLILFSQTMFGNVVAIRILRRFRHRSLISTTSLMKIGTAFASIMSSGASVLFFFREREPLMFIIMSLVVLQLTLKFKERRKIECLHAQFAPFLDRWLLNLRTGHAAASARESALNSSSEQFRASLAPLFDADPRGGHLFLTRREVQELRSAQSEPHSTVGRLQNLRDGHRRTAAFRRKSGQALRQAAIQSAVLTLMHAALCIFVTARGDAASNFDLIFWSSLLTFSGVLTLRLMARRIRWTI